MVTLTKSIKATTKSLQIRADFSRMRKVDKYQEFILWFAMPTVERMKLGIDTQKAFAEYYMVNETTLGRWKDRPDFLPRVDAIQMKWGQEKTSDVIQAVYKSAIKGNPMSQLLWLQYFKGFSAKKKEEEAQEVKKEFGVGDIRFLIEQLPDDLKQKHYGYLRELLDDASAHRNTDGAQDSGWTTRPTLAISDETDNNAQVVSDGAANALAESNSAGLRCYMVREASAYNHQSSARWW